MKRISTAGNVRRAVWVTLFAVAALCVASRTAACADAAQASVERFPCYSGYSTKLFDEGTLLRNWLTAQMPEAPRDRVTSLTPAPGRKGGPAAAPVTVTRSSPEMPVYRLDCGNLTIGCYVVRVIAMARPEDVDQYRKPLFVDLRVRSTAGEEQYYRQRVPYAAQFYAISEVYFLVDTPGPYTATLTVGKGSAVDLYVHNIELHDVLKGLPHEAAKQRPGLFTPEERDMLRRNADARQAIRDVAKWVKPMDPLWTDPTRTLSADERAARDEMLWNAFPPLNSQFIGFYPTGFPRGELQRPTSPDAKAALDQYGPWQANLWNYGPLVMTHPKLGLTYTRDDFVHHRPLPDPWPLKDDGGGVYLPQKDGMAHGENYAIIAAALHGRWCTLIGLLAAWDGDDEIHRVPYLYHVLGNRNAARDAALVLCRWAYIYPTISDAMVIDGALIAPAGAYNRDVRLQRRFLNEGLDGLQQGLITAYDYLFDYIKGNEELAQAVGRFVPWVKTDEDVRRLIETRLLQFGARQVMRFHIFNDKSTPIFLMRVAAVQQAPEITRPWMEFLWSRTWIYPHARAGLPDYLSTTTQRDGTTDIGSVFYTQGGTPFLDVALMTHRYVLNGGDPAFDLADLQRYRKVAEACSFPLTASVGGYPLSIGDVGGPAKPRLWPTFFTGLERNFRTGARLTGDPALAWITVHYFGRGGESDAEWTAVTKAAARQQGNPLLGQPSRVLANWAGILETGQEAQDYRFLRAAIMRVGTGYGHQHEDTLDLQAMAHGVRAVNDVGWRGGYSSPHPTWSQLHNLVEIDETNWVGHAWIPVLAPTPGAQYMAGVAVPPATHRDVTLRTRELALIDVDAGTLGERPPAPLPYSDRTRFDPKAVTPDSYIFDVQRVAGGKVHTFCFHGTISDQFDVNALHRGDVTDAQEKNYLRRFLQGPDLKTAGDAPDELVATWRLRRSEETLNAFDRDGKSVTYHLAMGEGFMQGHAYNPASPPKFTRLHLLGRAGDRVLTAWPLPTPHNPDRVTWPFLFVQKRGTNLQSVYPAIVEAYAGEPFITSVRELPVPGNETDAQRAVAVEVRTRNGRTDLCLSDPRRQPRTVAGVTAAAQFAYVSTDDRGLRLAAMTAGAELATPQGVLRLAAPEWTARVARIDYWQRHVQLDAAWPDATVSGEKVEFGNDKHRTSYTVVAAERNADGLLLTLDKALDLSYAHVVAADPAKRLLTMNIGPIGMYPGMNAGLTCTNEDNSKAWPCTVLGGDSGRYVYRLEKPFTAQDFAVGAVFRLWEFGVGDTARLAARAAVRRAPDGTFRVESNGKATWTGR